jgi:hypothetical protein
MNSTSSPKNGRSLVDVVEGAAPALRSDAACGMPRSAKPRLLEVAEDVPRIAALTESGLMIASVTHGNPPLRYGA